MTHVYTQYTPFPRRSDSLLQTPGSGVIFAMTVCHCCSNAIWITEGYIRRQVDIVMLVQCECCQVRSPCTLLSVVDLKYECPLFKYSLNIFQRVTLEWRKSSFVNKVISVLFFCLDLVLQSDPSAVVIVTPKVYRRFTTGAVIRSLCGKGPCLL